MRIDVTQEDIDQGTRGQCKLCPVALAISRASGFTAFVRFGVTLFDDYRLEVERSGLPQAAVDFICKFDSELPVQPFSFDLPLEP